jgi:hypothetical protein
MKSVPNLISYLHEFLWNFSQFLSIYYELFSSGSKFNSKNTDEWGPPVSRRFPRQARLSAHHHHVSAMLPRHAAPLACLKCAVGTARRCPDSHLTAPPLSEPRRRLARARPDRAVARSEAVVAGPCPSAPPPPSTPSVRR